MQSAAAQSLVLDQRIELLLVQGRLDHLDIDVEGGRLFVAALGADPVEVIELRAGKRIARLQPLHEPQGVVYLRESRRLLVANGAGGGAQAFADGKAPAIASAAAELAICGDADDLFFDSLRHQLYVICGEGLVQVIRQRDADHYEVVERGATAPGARTGLFVPSLAALYVAVPSSSGAIAEIRVFHIR